MISTERMASIVGKTARKYGISFEEITAQFPNRPTTEADFMAVAEWMQATWEARNAEVASKTVSINPPRPSSPQNWEDIIDGNYAIPYNGKTHFYRVTRKQGKGKWAGRTFVNVQERASDELYPIYEKKRATAVLFAIREYGVEAAGVLFAEELGSCRFCLKSLTDDNNPYKARGAGPDCGPKYLG